MDFDQWVGNALDALCRVQEILDEEPGAFFLTDAHARELRGAVDKHLILYSRLARAADQQGLLVSTVAPKHHMLWHLAFSSQWLRPRRGACYLDEDFMGRVKGIVQSCTAATPLHGVPSKVLDKYRWGMHFQYLSRAGR